MEQDFWKDKTVLVTGHTGFKGSWLCIWLQMMEAKVIGYALDPQNEDGNFRKSGIENKISDIRGDIRDKEKLLGVCQKYKPEIVFHLAAQPLVIASYENPYETYDVNVMGTMSMLEAIRKTESVKAAVFITTDKCYDNKETMEGYKEEDPFGGYDPYSSSKACDEILIASYKNSFFPLEKYDIHQKAIASVRAGNVIGGGDWAENRILPDCIRALEKDEPILIRNRNAIRPWQHVLEPLGGYIKLAEQLWKEPKKYSGGWNFGPEEDAIWTVWEVANEVINAYGNGTLSDGTSPDALHEAGKLLLNIDKAKTQLGWKPCLDVKTAIHWTVQWYKEREKRAVHEICLEQIQNYMELLK